MNEINKEKMKPWICQPSRLVVGGAVEYTDTSLHWGKKKTPNERPRYDIKQSDGEAPTLENWGMRNIPSLPLLQGPLWLRLETPDWVLFRGQTEQTLYQQDVFPNNIYIYILYMCIESI